MRKEIPPPVSHWTANQKRGGRNREKAKILTKASATELGGTTWFDAIVLCFRSIEDKMYLVFTARSSNSVTGVGCEVGDLPRMK